LPSDTQCREPLHRDEKNEAGETRLLAGAGERLTVPAQRDSVEDIKARLAELAEARG
jgi:hypothetical protein